MADDTLPDKCSLCALRANWPLETDPKFQQLSILFDKGIIKNRYLRKIRIGDNDEGSHFCLLSHKAWQDKKTECDAWQLDFEQSRSESMSLNLSIKIKDMTKTTKDVAILAVVLAGLSIAISLMPYIAKLSEGR
jgi:hypothetical protein